MRNHNAFIRHYGGQVNKIETEVGLRSHFFDNPDFEDFVALWDTGATMSCISPSIAEELGLSPIKLINVGGVNDSIVRCPAYLIDIRLPNGLILETIAAGTQPAGTDVLIGMDVISRGDFAISHDKEGNMHVSFVVPPLGQKVDFEKSASTANKHKKKHK